MKTPRKKATRESRQKVTTARSSADGEIDARVDVLADRLAPFVTRLRTLQEQARSLGVFPNDRELLMCPSCGLAEDVLAGGQLITSVAVGAPDTGMRFIEPRVENEPFRCPACGSDALAVEELGRRLDDSQVERDEVSERARAARRPPPPEELVGALQDRIHPTSGRLLSAKKINKRPRG